MMRVAIVNETLPYPPHAGNRTRTLNLMQRLAERHDVTYICRGSEDPIETESAVEYLRKRNIRTIIADGAPHKKSGAAFYARLAANLLSPLPYAVSSHNSPAIRRRIREMAIAGEVDLWQFEWLAYADAVADIPRTRTLVMAHNVESLIWQRYCNGERAFMKRQYLRRQWRKFERFERKVFKQVTGVVCVSEEDARLALREFSPARMWVVDNGIDRDYFEKASADRDPHTILFLGSLEWRPNLEAVKWLLDEIFPAVRRLLPSARLSIVGRKPPEWLRQAVSRHRNVELHADVPDVRTHLASAAVMAVPLRVGGGSRLKILEAMACGLPVVSTPVGCEGLALSSGREITVAGDAEDFAQSLVWSLQNIEKALAMAEVGRRLVYERYDWDVLARKLEMAWEQALRVGTTASRREPSVQAQPALG